MSDSAVENIIFLIGEQNECITGCKLPTIREVLSVFFYNHSTLKLTIRESARKAVEKAQDYWSRAGIPVRATKQSITHLEDYHQEWIKIHKNRRRKNSAAQKLRECDFKERLDKLFDIRYRDAESTLTAEQRQFLAGKIVRSRRGPVSTMVNDEQIIDCLTTQDAEEVMQEEQEAKSVEEGIRSTQTLSECNELSERLSQLSTESSLKRTGSSFTDEMSDYDAPKPKKRNIMTPELVAALDRTQISSRNATYILAAVASSLGFNLDDVNISKNVIHRHRIRMREQMAKNVKTNFPASNFLVVHWDGKLLPEIVGRGTVERLPIIVSGVETEQLLGVPKLVSGTGVNQASAIVKTLTDWNLSERVRAMCFDTTSTNTGRLNGACTLVEQRLQKTLLHLACRHHISELLLRSVVETTWPTTTGPNVPVFKRFEQNWGKIDTADYQTGIEDEFVRETLRKRKDEIVDFILDQFEVSQPRDDYREFLELACIFLGAVPPRGVKFKSPGAMHHARWLSKTLYCLKMFLFRRQFKLKAREANGLKHICLFIVCFYVETWFKSPSAIKAPNHDLQLIKRLIEYRSINANVAKAALNKLTGHLWYLSEELAALSFFDDEVSHEVKLEMAQAITTRESTARIIRRQIRETDLKSIATRNVSDFITTRSIVLFEQFELSSEFLQKPPELWDDDESFKNCQFVFKNMRVVNDVAERGVALISKYNKALTNDEEQKQFLLQVVKSHHQQYPNANKKTLNIVSRK